MLMDLTSDLRTAFRMLRRNPGTSGLIVSTLALAIGAATIGFAFADLALFRGLPVDDNVEGRLALRVGHARLRIFALACRLRICSTIAPAPRPSNSYRRCATAARR